MTRMSIAFYAAHVRTEDADGESHHDRPLVDLVDPTPAQARHAVVGALPPDRLTHEQTAGLELAVSEVVTNAIVHGRSPVVVRAYLHAASGVVVTVRDAGSGPVRPPDDSLPTADADGGRGWWICRRSVDIIDGTVDDDGYVVRLVVGG